MPPSYLFADIIRPVNARLVTSTISEKMIKNLCILCKFYILCFADSEPAGNSPET